MLSFLEESGQWVAGLLALASLVGFSEVFIRNKENREKLGNKDWVPHRAFPALVFSIVSAIAAIVILTKFR